MILLCIYVDDLLVTGNNRKTIEEFKEIMKDEFEISYLGKLSYFLGIEFTKTEGGLLMHQKKFSGEILRRYNMDGCNLDVTPIEVNIYGESKALSLDDSQEDHEIHSMHTGAMNSICNRIEARRWRLSKLFEF
uniref:Uncharacterized protein LOC113786653 n=1 Tax=Cicer arietinum TaxID=3827 RepID=A0A3Q7YBD2_CICAR|nr:uncharacterized protein LOC113786653 [Cicer arietinum]